jgi:hypothetical protein
MSIEKVILYLIHFRKLVIKLLFVAKRVKRCLHCYLNTHNMSNQLSNMLILW